ncbi:MAG TPA: hypothetical protein VIV12_05805 [Streptosporangiaceae bacterium]
MRAKGAHIAGWVAAIAVTAVAVIAVMMVLADSPGGGRATPEVQTVVPAPHPTTTVNPFQAPAMPARGAYLGAYVQPAAYTQAADIAAIQTLQSQLGRRLAIVHSYLRWQVPFPTISQQAILNQGSTLLLSWAGTDTHAINSGAYDGWIRQQAHAIKAAHKQIFLEWRWEMDRQDLVAQVHSPRDYVRAWKRLRSIFASEHVKNVAWVWCPSTKGFGLAIGHRPAPPFYPGNRQVDWLCADAYPKAGETASFASLVQPFLAWASHIRKPVMIGEFGAPRSYGPQARARWLRAAAQVVRGNSQIKALVYFDGDPAGHFPSMQYHLDAGTAPLLAFRAIAAQRYFNPPLRRAPH